MACETELEVEKAAFATDAVIESVIATFLATVEEIVAAVMKTVSVMMTVIFFECPTAPETPSWPQNPIA